jgi:regulator of protease activity HflC (stomatin/prohibitin superfamily)
MVCVKEMDAGVVESCGKYSRILPPGLHCICFPIEAIAANVSLKIKHTEVSCDTKSKDNVFVTVVVAGKGSL